LRGKIVEPSSVLRDHCGWSSLNERIVLQFCLDRSRFLIGPGDFRVQSVALARLVRGSDREKNLA